MGFTIKRVGHLVLRAKDMQRSREFYETTLGLTPGEDFDGKWQEYDIGLR